MRWIARLPPVRRWVLRNWRFAGGPEGVPWRALFHYGIQDWFHRVYLAEADPDRREALKRTVMAAQAAVWVRAYGGADPRGRVAAASQGGRRVGEG